MIGLVKAVLPERRRGAIGNAAFFAPLTGILPESRAPPSTTILSMGFTEERRVFRGYSGSRCITPCLGTHDTPSANSP